MWKFLILFVFVSLVVTNKNMIAVRTSSFLNPLSNKICQDYTQNPAFPYQAVSTPSTTPLALQVLANSFNNTSTDYTDLACKI